MSNTVESNQKIELDFGKKWWEVIRKYTVEIQSFEAGLMDRTVLTEMEMEIKGKIREGFLDRLRQELKPEWFLSLKWKFVHGGQETELPPELQCVAKGTLRRYYNQALIQTGRLAIRENWTFAESREPIAQK